MAWAGERDWNVRVKWTIWNVVNNLILQRWHFIRQVVCKYITNYFKRNDFNVGPKRFYVGAKRPVSVVFSQMGVQSSCGRPLIKENWFFLRMLLSKLFIWAHPILDAHFSNPDYKSVIPSDYSQSGSHVSEFSGKVSTDESWKSLVIVLREDQSHNVLKPFFVFTSTACFKTVEDDYL